MSDNLMEDQSEEDMDLVLDEREGEVNEAPIQSNITSTDDGMTAGMFSEESSDEDADDGWDDLNDWSDMILKDPSEVIIDSTAEQKLDENGENPLGEGKNHCPERPVIPPEKRVWQCRTCRAHNAILRVFCVNPNCRKERIIDGPSADPILEGIPDRAELFEEEKMYWVWQCPMCTWLNEEHFGPHTCGMCKQQISVEVCNAIKFLDHNRPPPPPQEVSIERQQNRVNAAQQQQQQPYKAHNGVWSSYSSANANSSAARRKDPEAERQMSIRRRKARWQSRTKHLGQALKIDAYPSKFGQNVETRLSNVFGVPYCNKFILDASQSWIYHQICTCDLKGMVRASETQAIDSRLFAIDSCGSGWIAAIQGEYISLFEPVGRSYRPFAMSLVSAVLPNYFDLCKGHSVRLRLVGKSIFFFSSSNYKIYELGVLSYEDTVTRIELANTYTDKYMKEASTVDIEVTKTHIVILFDRWMGFFERPTGKNNSIQSLSWFHAVAYASSSMNPSSFVYMSSLDNLKSTAQQELEARDIEMKWDNKPKYDHENFVYIASENQLIAIHPSNSTFEYLHVAPNIGSEASFAVSRRHGTFYLNENGTKLYQSHQLHFENLTEVFALASPAADGGKKVNWFENGDPTPHCVRSRCKDNGDCLFDPMEQKRVPLHIKFAKLLHVTYDETFGLSGRLLLYGQLHDGTHAFSQLLNMKDFQILRDKVVQTKYVRNPGFPGAFDMMVWVFEYLYGDELITELLDSSFNPNVGQLMLQQAQVEPSEPELVEVTVTVGSDLDKSWVAVNGNTDHVDMDIID